MRPFSWVPLRIKWRGDPEFGCGAVGVMACHILGTPNMALRLTAAISVECVEQEGKGKYTFPEKVKSVLRRDLGCGKMPPVSIFWHDGMQKKRDIQGVPAGELLGDKRHQWNNLGSATREWSPQGVMGSARCWAPAAKMADYELPSLSIDPLARPLPRLDSGRKRRLNPPVLIFIIAGPILAQWMLPGVRSMERIEGKLMWDAEEDALHQIPGGCE